MTQRPYRSLLKPSSVNTVPCSEYRDSFADLVPVARATSFLPRPFSSAPVHPLKPLGSITNGKNHTHSSIVMQGPTMLHPAGSAITKDGPTTPKAVDPVIFMPETPKPSQTGRVMAASPNKHGAPTHDPNVVASPPRNEENRYIKQDMHQSKHIMPEVQEIDDEVSDDVYSIPLLDRKRPIKHSPSVATSRHDTLPASPEDRTGPIVQPTEDLYDTLNEIMKTLTQKKSQLLRNEGLSTEENRKLHWELDHLSILTELTGGMKKEGDSRQAISHQIKSDMPILQVGTQMVDQAHTGHEQQHLECHRKMIGEIAKRDKEIAELKICLSNAHNSTAIIQSLASERTNLITESTTQINNMKETLLDKEKAIKTQTEEIERLATMKDELTGQLEQLREKFSPPQDTIDTLGKRLREKALEICRLNHDLHLMKKKHQQAEERVLRVANTADAIRGAAHLAAPAPNSKLSTTIFSCISCYVKSLTCDNGATCANCKVNGDECNRWRCSLAHILKNCPTSRPCQLVHGSDGWLMTQEPRPEW